MLNAQQVTTFAQVAKLGSFTRAAESLDLTQAAVSQQVQQIERELGPLLLRKGRRLELTPAGLALEAYAREMSDTEQRLRQTLTRDDATRGAVKLVSPGSIGLAVYPLLLDLQGMHPGLSIQHRFAPTHDVFEGVLAARDELGLSVVKPDEPRLLAERLTEESLELVLPANAKVDDWSDLMALGFIDHPDGQDMASRLLPRMYPGCPSTRTLPVRGFTNQVGLILEPVARGFGFTVIPHHARAAFTPQTAIRVVKGNVSVQDTLWLVHRAEWPMSGPAATAVQWLKAHWRGFQA
jgi:DNA-binding transcriptional LysR family regulator